VRVFRSLDEVAAVELRRAVVTLGMFDGVHIGHRLVIEHVVSLARERAGEAVVVTFGRHPRAVIEQRAPKLITSLPHKLRIFEALGVTAVLVLEFDHALRATPAREFARKVLGDVLAAEVVLLGYNNRFGRGGEGDITLLEEVGRDAGFEARQLDEVRLEGEPLSSTAIREAILEGDLDHAASMLGRPASVLGTVERGDGLGKQIGFPTANLDLHHEVRPPPGVYGCEAVVGGQFRFGLVNIGTRPTLHGDPAPEGWEARDREERVEVHLLDFEGDLYGQDVEIVFLVRLRDERRFDGLDALVAQIRKDREVFHGWLEGAPGRDR
jgi:riboflavin kinase/FMN adenylyltransferase